MLDGVEITTLDAEALRQMRGRDVGMVFQDPTTTLNPVFPIGRQVIEGQVAHGQVPASQAHSRAVDLLREVLRDEQLDCDYREPGTLTFALSEQELARMQNSASQMCADGMPVEVLVMMPPI